MGSDFSRAVTENEMPHIVGITGGLLHTFQSL
jgi:hypothetical protein